MERPRARMAVNPSRWIHLNDRATALALDEKRGLPPRQLVTLPSEWGQRWTTGRSPLVHRPPGGGASARAALGAEPRSSAEDVAGAGGQRSPGSRRGRPPARAGAQVLSGPPRG